MRADFLLRGLPIPVRVFALVGLMFVLGVFGSAAVAATKHLLAPRHAIPAPSVLSAKGLRGPDLKQRRRAPQRRPAALSPRALARGILPPEFRGSAPAPAAAAAPAEAVPITSAAAAEPQPEGPRSAPGSQAPPPLTKSVAPPVTEGENEPPAEEPPAEEPPAEEPPAEEPPAEEPPAEEPPAEEPWLNATSIRSFWLNQSAPGAITEVPDPAGSGETVFKFTVGDTDLTAGSTSNPRGELIARPNITAGDEFWWSTKFFLPADFPASTPGFVNLLQVFGSPASGSPPFHIEANGGVLKWQRNATYGWDVPWQMPQVRNQWVSVMVHERFAGDGFVELWINGQQVTFFSTSFGVSNPNGIAPTTRLQMATMDSSNSGGANSLYLQLYRQRGMYPTLTTYAGPLLMGPTRASVGG